MFIQTMNQETHSPSLTWDQVQAKLNGYEATKYDVTTKSVRFEAADNGIQVVIDGIPHNISKDGKLQILNKISPSGSSYLKLCPDDLLAVNLNHWYQDKYSKPNRTCVMRCRDTEQGPVLRGIVSERFAKLDHHRIFQDIRGRYENGLAPRGLVLNDDRMVMRLAAEEQIDMGTLQRGDLVGGGVDIFNSELGNGAVKLNAITFRVLCTNGMISPHTLQERGKAHVGTDLNMESFLETASSSIRKMAEDMLGKTSASQYTQIQNADMLFGFLADHYGWSDRFRQECENNLRYHQVPELGVQSKYAFMQAITERAKQEKQDQRLKYEAHAGSILYWDTNDMEKQAQEWREAELAKEERKAIKRMHRARR